MADNITLPITPLSAYPKPKPAPNDLIGVNAAIAAAADPSSASLDLHPTITGQFSLAGKTAVVTGGNSGIGLEYCVVLAELGATVVAIDLAKQESDDFKACQSYVARLKGLPASAALKYRVADVTDPESIQPVIAAVAEEHGSLDVCIANAGILGPIIDCHKYPYPDFKKIIDVNVNGAFLTCQAGARAMLDRGIKGSIIITASMSGSIINRDMHWLPYNVSKGAALQLGRGLACELGAAGIRVNTISPGHVRTRLLEGFLQKEPLYENQWAAQNPLDRIGAVYELRGAVAYLASDASTYTTGSDLQVCGGHTSW